MKHDARFHHPRPAHARTEFAEAPSSRVRRRSQRLTLSVPVVVYGRFDKRIFFRETATMLKVSKHGGLVALNTEVRPGEELVLRRRTTNQEQGCRVVFIGPDRPGGRNVGVEFTGQLSDFWHIYFPPVSAKPAPEFVQL